MVGLSVGLWHIDDLQADLANALDQVWGKISNVLGR